MAGTDADVIVAGAASPVPLAALQIARAGHDGMILKAVAVLPDWKITENFRARPRKETLNAPFRALRHAPDTRSPGYGETDIDVTFLPRKLRIAGGTSRHWTGVALRFLPEEMRMRPGYGIGCDWPFGHDEQEPYDTQDEYQVGVIRADDAHREGLRHRRAWLGDAGNFAAERACSDVRRNRPNRMMHPTLTGMALAARVGHHIAQEI